MAGFRDRRMLLFIPGLRGPIKRIFSAHAAKKAFGRGRGGFLYITAFAN